MYNLVDSSGWLEYFANGPNAAFFAPAVEHSSKLIVPTIVIYEVYKRGTSLFGRAEALEKIAPMFQSEVADVTAEVAMRAAELSLELHLAMADSLILATAESFQAILWTEDVHFERLPNVKYVKKQ